MNKLKNVLFLPIILVVAVFVGHVSLAQAAVNTLQIVDVSFLQCAGSVIEGRMRVIATDVNGTVINASTPFEVVEYYSTSNGSLSPQNGSYISSTTYGFYISHAPAPLNYVEVYMVAKNNPAVRSNVYRVSCGGVVTDLGGGTTAGGAVAIGFDDRINRGAGDLVDALYVGNDSSSKPGILVYSIVDGTSQGVYAGSFSYDDFAKYISSPPTTNTRIATVGDSTLYALATGEFQINIVSEIDKKLYGVIFSGLPPKYIYYRTLE